MKRNMPDLIGFVSAIAGLVAFSSCASQPPKPIPTRQSVVRTAEKLHVVRQPLEKLQAGTGTGALSVPGTNGQPVSLFLTDDEAALLKAANRSQSFEVRYWYHEADSGFGVMPGQADLESVRDAETVIIDRSRCRLHNEVMTRRPVRISYGLPNREFVEAMHHNFPNAAIQLGGCVITGFSPKDSPAYVCPVCDVAYQTWRPASDKDRAP